MKIIDCILYNGEADILSLRLELMGGHVDRFLIVEAPLTFSGLPKQPTFPRDRDLFSVYLEKIDYHLVDIPAECRTPWEREYFLRDSLRGLAGAADDDVVIIADTDEIVNLQRVKSLLPPAELALIELPTYCFFLNVRSSETIRVTLIAKFGAIKNQFIGNRRLYKTVVSKVIPNIGGMNGGHFTYMFGNNIAKYLQKIRSFSHAEYVNDHFLDVERIATCIRFNLDLLERDRFALKNVKVSTVFPGLAELVENRPEYERLIRKRSVARLVGNVAYLNAYLFRRLIRVWGGRLPKSWRARLPGWARAEGG